MHRSLTKRAAAAVVALAIAAPAAWAATSDSSHTVVHSAIDRTGSINVTGYDGGVSLTGNSRP